MSKESNRGMYWKAEDRQFQEGERRRNGIISTSYRHDSVKHLEGGPSRPSLRTNGKHKSDRYLTITRNRKNNDVSKMRSRSFSDLFEDNSCINNELHLQPSGATRQQNSANPSRKLSTRFENTSINIPQKSNPNFYSTPRLVSKKR